MLGRLEQRPGGTCVAGRKGERRAMGAAAGPQCSLCRAGATRVRGLDSRRWGLSDALGPGQKQGQAAGWHSDPRVLELGDSSGAGRTGPFLDIY